MYPLFADIAGRNVLVIGGGPIAHRKVQALLAGQADVQVISPSLTADLLDLHNRGLIKTHQRPYHPGDLARAWLVIAATDDQKINRQVAAQAAQRRIFCNVVDEPDLCTFHAPAVLQRGQLQIAISTGGASPALAQHIRQQLHQLFGEYYETFLQAARDLRTHVKQKYPHQQNRRAEILRTFIDSEALELLRTGKLERFDQLLTDWKKH